MRHLLAEVILKAHKALETITLTKDVAHFKPIIEKQFAEQLYNGLWFSPLTDSLKLFIDSTQQYVSGDVRIKLFKGNAIVNGRKSPYTLYDEKLATYTKEDAFNQDVCCWLYRYLWFTYSSKCDVAWRL